MKIHLYVKQHQITKLKYFGKTTGDPLKYKGSGKYWMRHIKKHDRKHVITIQIWEFDNEYDAQNFALNFSKDNDIVNSVEWANLKEENGLDGNPIGNWKGKTYEEIYGVEKAKLLRESRSKSNKNRKCTQETRDKLSKAGKNYTAENNPMFGKIHSIEARKKIGESSKGRKWTIEQKEKFKKSRVNLKLNHKIRVCPHCLKSGRGGNMTRYHFDNCRFIDL